MRTKNGLKNIIYSTGYYLLVSVLGLLIRKLTLSRFGTELLGYFGVIDNIFSWLNLAELGVGSVIIYSLYKALAENDLNQTRLIMSVFRVVYKIIGTVLLVSSLILSFALPAFFPNNIGNLRDAYILYFIEAGNMLSTYFLSYCRVFFEANQKGYLCMRLDMANQLFCWILRMLIVWKLPFYPLYYGLPVAINILVNLIIFLLYHKKYPQESKPVKITLQDLQKLNFFKDLKHFGFAKLSGVVFSSTDNIILSRVFGVAMVTATGNYLMIWNRAYQLLGRFSAGITAGIGNLNYSTDVSLERKKQIFVSLDLAEYYIAAIAYVAFALLFQPFIQLWLGKERLLSDAYVWILAVSAYLNLARRMINEYRAGLGRFEMDMWYSLAGTLVNLVLSILGAYYLGVEGVIAATAVGHLIIWAGYLKVVERQLFPGMKKTYIKKHVIFFAVATVLAALLWKLTMEWPVTIKGLFARACCAVIVPAVAITFLFLHGDNAAYLREKVEMVWKLMRASR